LLCTSQGKPRKCTSSFGHADLQNHITAHLSAEVTSIPDFGSWAISSYTALRYAGDGNNSHGQIVVIGTKKLDRKPEIFHTKAISQAVLYWSNGATAIYDYKYVAYGPLKGHGYHTMAVESAY
jgi:hypothetical protein